MRLEQQSADFHLQEMVCTIPKIYNVWTIPIKKFDIKIYKHNIKTLKKNDIIIMKMNILKHDTITRSQQLNNLGGNK